uniref:Putative theromacin-like protein n=1 Tax=Haementeria vizottoi TaxID=1628691 RepID=A0A0P4VTK6_9ANNE
MRAIVVLGVLVFMLACSSMVESSAKGCFDDWSRCSPATSGGTGKLWLPCNEYCKICFKADGGNCVNSPSKNCPGLLKNNKQCVCRNARSKKNNLNPLCWA